MINVVVAYYELEGQIPAVRGQYFGIVVVIVDYIVKSWKNPGVPGG